MQNIFLILFLKTFNLCSSLKVKTTFHQLPQKTGKIVLYTLIFCALTSLTWIMRDMSIIYSSPTFIMNLISESYIQFEAYSYDLLDTLCAAVTKINHSYIEILDIIHKIFRPSTVSRYIGFQIYKPLARLTLPHYWWEKLKCIP
jgi:hypothetical protein